MGFEVVGLGLRVGILVVRRMLRWGCNRGAPIVGFYGILEL